MKAGHHPPPAPAAAGRPRRRSRWSRRLVRVSAGLLALAATPWLAFRAAVAWWPYPAGIDAPPPAATRLEDRNGAPLAMFTAPDGRWRLPLAAGEISPHLMDAIVAVEDGRFYDHAGVDWRSVGGAVRDDLLSGRVRRGASTISMQVQRLRDPRPRTFLNKVEQAVRAEQLERRSTKRAVLVEYLNRAPFGGNLVGAGAASWRYFDKPCSQLSLGEAALLAGLPQNPNRFRPDRDPRKAAGRRDHVLDRMAALGMISPAQAAEAKVEPVTAAWRPLPQDRPAGGPPPADGGQPTLVWLAGRYPGRTVQTTLDAAVQRQAAAAAGEQLRALAPSGVTAVAVVVVDTPTGECLAAVSHHVVVQAFQPARNDAAGQRVDVGVVDVGVGCASAHRLSVSPEERCAEAHPTSPALQQNALDLTRRPRSTGSALKPLIYAAAFDAGSCSPDTLLDDAPAAWPGYAPANYDRQFRGSLSAADALAESRNIPAMLVLSRVGVERAVGVMDAAGLHGLARAERPYGLSLAVGGAEATPAEVAEAYAMLGRGGTGRPVTLVRPSEAGPTTSPAVRCLRAEACWQALGAISRPERTAGVCPEAVGAHVAWKTGTSSGHHDAWCAAVTPRRTVVVWLGNPGGQGAAALVGQEAAAPLALRLIAALDPAGGAWPAVKEEANPAPLLAAAAARATGGLTLISPANGQEFVLSPDLPADRQRVRLEAVRKGDSAGDGGLWWVIDGDPVAAGAGGRGWWTPKAGTHEVRVIDGRGHSATATVRVKDAGANRTLPATAD